MTKCHFLNSVSVKMAVGVLLLLGAGTLGMAQRADSLRWQQSIAVVAQFATNDHFGNTYVVTTDNAVVKFDSVGRKTAVFTNKRLGVASSIDATNPLKVLVWYPDFQTVLLLDRTLTEMGRLALPFTTRCVGTAADGNIWAFDDGVSKLFKYGLDGTLLRESQPLNVYFSQRFSATSLQDNARQVYVNDPAAGMCVLDQYANLEKTLPFYRLESFKLETNTLVSLGPGNIRLETLDRLENLELPLPAGAPDDPASCWLGLRRWYWQHGSTLKIYGW